MEVKHALSVPTQPVEGVPGVTIRWLWATPDVFEVQPGAATPYHTHRYEHEVYVMNGQARLRGEMQEYVLEAGDTALVLPSEPHQFVNIGPDVLRFLSGIPLSRESIGVTAQVSLYSLRQEHLSPAIEAAIEAWQAHGIKVILGAMSTSITDETGMLWVALRDGFIAACAHGETVMVVTVSNACPRLPP
jgi:uncharacterized protein YqgV (UPF0045/DUF77 family)